MRTRTGLALFVVLVYCAGFVAPLNAQGTPTHFVISGTSTVRAWSCPAEGIAKVVAGKLSQPVTGFPHGVQAIEVTIPVKAIACEDARMVEHLRELMNEKNYPQIVYRLEHYELTGNDTAKTTGTLTITSVTKPINLDVKLVPSPQGLRSVGETSIDMTEFGIAPPVIWEGLLKVGKDVRVRFDAVLQPSEKSAGLHD